MAADMVSRSRISPIRITSGAWRSAFFSAVCSDCVSLPISRWFTMDFLLRNWYSTGSSIVRMWPVSWLLRLSIIDASVVLLPEPVAPTTRIRPRFSRIRSPRMGGRFRVAKSGICCVMKRITTA
ncbi:hypothetical protein AcdelDRAFT_3137 [Acidovorax delafieldii 2AN]|uniref:Uncharacterized protein n=1 Tax=Acidovorax delafieldii 2AN TaxID=573060 RepID=C5T8A7_ACIDE|nr:hypothetical protein AcdelDRAFT_3137 [Acidovorax delafieldii 2AN]